MADLTSATPSESALTPRRPPRGTPGTAGLTGIVVAVVVVLALYFGRAVLIPITLAMLLSFLLAPVVELLRRLWLGRIVSVLLTVLLALCVMLALGTAIGSQVAHLSANVPQYEKTIEKKIHDLRDVTVNRLSEKIESIGHQLSNAAQSPAGRPSATPGVSAHRQAIPVVITEPTPSAFQIGEAVISPLLSPLATAGIILVVTIFALLQKEDLRDRVIRLIGSKDLRRTTVAMNEAGRRLSRYFVTQFGLNTTFGIVIAIGLYFIGVPNPVLWGILGALLRFVPYIGSWIAALLPMALAMAVTPGWSMVIWTGALYAITEVTMGQAVEPLVYGHSTGLTPIAVIIAAIFWTWMWGPIGLIISTPLTLCLVVVGRHVKRLAFLDVLLGDRPALSPAEGFYQRILADDPEEAQAQAEDFLDKSPLCAYYDEVVLKGMQLAGYDLSRQILPDAAVERIRGVIHDLITDLESHDDATPGAPRSREPPGDEAARAREILCIAGRGPLDELVARMLHQVLDKQGLRARVIPHERVSRAQIHSFQAPEAGMVCLCYLDIGGNPAHLHYLLLRLRKQLRNVPLLVGFWPQHDPMLEDRHQRERLGADYSVSTLREAITACVAVTRGTTAAARQNSTEAASPVDSTGLS